jgi:exonuclease SbcC
MRPRELRISGLTAFASPVTVDFTDASLFALVGATGAGKSSVVDAMTLALYGRVSRLHANEIAPIISTTASECTVGLTFTVRGRLHRAVRTVRRTKTGASTLEAVLDHLDDDGAVLATLAGTADDVTLQVEQLIGLSFDEFTRAVVLPQGEFARVLRAKASDRQSLLARLLGTGVYDRVKQRAGAHGRAAQDRAEQTAHQIAQLGAVDDAQVAALLARVADLDDLVGRLAADTQALEAIRERFRDAAARSDAARARVDRLGAIAPPPQEVTDLADSMVQAAETCTKLRAALQDAESQLTAAEDAMGDPDRLGLLTDVVAAHRRTPDLARALETAESALPALSRQITDLTAGLAEAEQLVDTARVDQARLHREHAAVQAADGLVPGDDCPVCAATIGVDAPALRPGGGQAQLEVAAAALTEAIRTASAIGTTLARARTDLDRATADRDRAAADLAAHVAALAGQPTAGEAAAALDLLREQQQRIAGLRGEARRARDDLDRADRARRALDDQAAGLAQRLDRLRLAVAEQDPPALDGRVAEDWAALHRWAQAQVPAARSGAEEAAAAVAAVQAEGSALRAAMEQACTDAAVPPGADDPRDRAVQARADAAAEATRLQQVARMVDALRADEADAREQAAVGTELARLLRADQFQKWLLDEATRALVAGASEQLLALSSGRYELALDGRGAIQVVDLASAGSIRSVRTLSGGETFLASLALALSLAEQIARSASGPVALESLFIDEGFGALDHETLDIATGAIEQLGAGDRTVGVITHVADMADRLPTRFVVRRAAGGSQVDRVDA